MGIEIAHPDPQLMGSPAGVRLRQPFFSAGEYAFICEDLSWDLERLPQAPEGHISPLQAEFLFHFIRLVKPELVVETGFCVGHSACVVLHAQKSAGLTPRLLSVDNCQFKETKPAVRYVLSRFENFVFAEGDSKEVLASAIHTHLRANEGLTMGLGLVDGGHDAPTALHDLETMLSFLTLGGYLWLDDFEKLIPCAGANAAGRNFAIKWGSCHRYRTGDTRGFMIYQKAF